MEQRRSFSQEYVNVELQKCDCYVDLSIRNLLSQKDSATVEDLKQLPCILISSHEQRYTEQDFYENTLGFGGSFLFAESLEERRLMIIGNDGFMPIELVGAFPAVSPTLKRLPLCLENERIQHNYCAFRPKAKTNCYIEAFAEILKKLLSS